MRPVRVADALYTIGPLACPRCDRVPGGTLATFGIIRLRCDNAQCRRRWTAIWLPPGSTCQGLLDLFHASVVRAIVQELRPGERIARPDLGGVPLPADDGLTFVQHTAGGMEPPMDWRQARAILVSLLRRVA